jgi:hypothetical protein
MQHAEPTKTGQVALGRPQSRRWPLSDPVRARSAILWGLAIVVGGQLALTAGLEGPFTQLRDPEFGYKLACLRRQQARKPDAPLVLLLGSSRVALGIRPEMLPPWSSTTVPKPLVFNFSLVGSGPVMELMCLDRLLSAGVRPDWVIVECWPPFWYQEDANAEESRIDVNRLSETDLHLLARYWRHPDQLRLEYAEARLLPWYAHRFRLVERWAPAWVPFMRRQDMGWRPLNKLGWLPNSQTAAGSIDQHRLQVERLHSIYGPIMRRYRVSDVSDRALRELLKRCQRRRIAVALLLMPEGSDLRALYPASVQTDLDRYMARISREYQVPVIDGRLGAPDSDFSDGFHLLPGGATRFTRRLGTEALQPLLKGHRAATSLTLSSAPAGEEFKRGDGQAQPPSGCQQAAVFPGTSRRP